MSAVSATAGAAVPPASHGNAANATQNLQQIQQEAIAKHQAETAPVNESGVDIIAL